MDERIEELMRQLSDIETKSAQLRQTLEQETALALQAQQEANRRKEEAERIMAQAQQVMAQAEGKRQAAENLMAEVLQKQQQAEQMMKEAVELVNKAKQMQAEIAFVAQPTEDEFVEDSEPISMQEKEVAEPTHEVPADAHSEAGSSVKEEKKEESVQVEARKESNNMIGEMKIDSIHLSLGDRFHFQRELFGGNGELLTQTISALNECNSLQEAEEYIAKHFAWDTNTEAYELFFNILKRRW